MADTMILSGVGHVSSFIDESKYLNSPSLRCGRDILVFFFCTFLLFLATAN